MTLIGRAESREQKRLVAERILAAWQRAPQERLGQFLENAKGTLPNDRRPDIRLVEDFLLAELCELRVGLALDNVVPTPSETEATLRALVEAQSARLLKYAGFTRKVVEAADATVKLTDTERLRVIRGAVEGIR